MVASEFVLVRLLRRHLGDYLRPIALLAVLQIAQTAATIYLPRLNADLIDNGVVRGDIGYVIRVGGVMLAVSVVQVLCVIAATWTGVRTASAIARDLRLRVFDHVQEFSAREVAEFGAPSLIVRTTNDIQQVQNVVLMTFTTMVVAPLVCAGAIAMAFALDVPLASLLLAIVPVLGIEAAMIIRRARPLFRDAQGNMDRVNRVLREQIGGVRVIRAFVRDGYERQRFGGVNARLADVSARAGKLTTLIFPLMNTCVSVFSVLVTWLAAVRTDAGAMQVGVLTALLNYLALILTSVMMANSVFMALPRAEACAERIREVLTTTPSVRPPAVPVRPAHNNGELSLTNVTFGYPGAEAVVLSGVDLVAEPGRTTAIIGPTGSGKTTLLRMVARLLDVTSGAVLVDGVDVRDLDPDLLTSQVALVSQPPYLFAGTVASNLRYGRDDATDERLWQALAVAQARDFVDGLPDGLDSPVAQGGTNLSGGQRQRLAIARALVREPKIYLFDDCFSALDYVTEARLRAALASQVAGATIVIVAQRVSTVRDADRIVVLDEGRVVGTGTHRDLLATNSVYREIALSQRSDEEVG